MCQCQARVCCDGCSQAIDRRRFLRQGSAAVMAAGCLLAWGRTTSAQADRKARVAAVFLAQVRNSWPYPGFDAAGRQREILAVLAEACPDVEFVPITVQTLADTEKALSLCDQVDGLFVYMATLSWELRSALAAFGKLNKPLLVASEFLGGCGAFLTGVPPLVRQGGAVALSTTRLDDLAAVVREFAPLCAAGLSPAEVARRCEQVYCGTFAARNSEQCLADSPQLTDIGQCVAQFRESKVLVLGSGRGGQQQNILGATWQYVDWNELEAVYPEVDADEATEWAARWTQRAAVLPPGEYVEPSVPPAEEIHNAAIVYLAILRLLKKHGTDMITANCGGGLGTSRALRGFPCLGFAQLLDDGGLGICEASVDDTPPMLMARLLAGRPGFVSDPALDTSQNRIVYSHCVGPTKVFGPQGPQNGFQIRTSHARVGAVLESLMPAGYMTTTFRTNVARKQMVIHQARSLGPLASEKGCRTKLIGEVHGDIGKMFSRWDQFEWHRVTVFGDLKDPLTEFGKALGLEVIEEA
ncbi:MAG: hypothetical protein ACYC4U_08985 [Pirellulaceae bacterium]